MTVNRVFHGHEDDVKSCQFCDHDKKILTSSFDKKIILWDVESGEKLRVFDGVYTDRVNNARASVDVKKFVSCGWDKQIHLWDIETGQVLWSGRHHGVVTCCNMSNDSSGKLVVSGSDMDNAVKVWDTVSGDLVYNLQDFHKSTISSCAFSPSDGRIVTTSFDWTTKLYDLRSNCTTITLEGHVNVVSGAAFSKDERFLVTVAYDKSIKFWDIATGIYRLQGPVTVSNAHEGCFSSCSISSDGSTLVTGGFDQRICTWDMETHASKLHLQAHDDWVEDVGFSNDRKWIVSCSKDRTVRLWNTADSENYQSEVKSRKSTGLKLLKCSKCERSFSLADVNSAINVQNCVCCQLESEDRAQTTTPNIN